MAEGFEVEVAEVDFEELLRESDVRGYLYEPQYSNEQLRMMEEQEAVEAAAAPDEQDLLGGQEEEPEQARVGSDWWCQCTCCAPMETEKESLCCYEFHRCQFLLEEMADSAHQTAPLACVTQHPSFEPHMDRGVLETYFRTPKINWKRQPKPAGRNGRLSVKQYRLTAYRHFMEWVLQGERLGKGYRLVLPTCVVQYIRRRFPAPDGQYCGYKETAEALEEL
ncbi:uncharacterized protein [Misgurnus anguillicaudatus]|uniref:uncharacterized protein n=1 Tax=Misgurnus anguillicaudatus TaxID=75329 RepID=UPI002435FB90|nr:P2X purinoceptor 7-like [Misgurnus anguillicaudatus]XP_055068420.1 P2X purinoceptor 7-like [Misgurnus anguillicaudatus]